MVRVVKRNGSLVDFDKSKIFKAILKAMTVGNTINESIANKIADDAERQYKDEERVSISDIETFVFDELCKYDQQVTAKAYEGYRSIREFQRKASDSIEGQVKELVDGDSEYWNSENSNKNAKLVTTQRDYMAGIVSKEITRKYILTPDIVQAHDDGIIHFHDIDYMGQNALSNCCLINLDDMLQYGTVINKVKIDKPHRLITATTLSTQVITAVTSSQYGLR